MDTSTLDVSLEPVYLLLQYLVASTHDMTQASLELADFLSARKIRKCKLLGLLKEVLNLERGEVRVAAGDLGQRGGEGLVAVFIVLLNKDGNRRGGNPT